MTLGVNILTSYKYLKPVTQSEFKEFVQATDYITDAEKYGWSFCQQTITDFKICNCDWKTESYDNLVVHVSYNDAVAYSKWSNTRLPTLEEYWQLSKHKKDVWDWTQEGYLAGGSYLCSIKICAGFLKGNEKNNISKDTTNRNIGFQVIINEKTNFIYIIINYVNGLCSDI